MVIHSKSGLDGDVRQLLMRVKKETSTKIPNTHVLILPYTMSSKDNMRLTAW